MNIKAQATDIWCLTALICRFSEVWIRKMDEKTENLEQWWSNNVPQILFGKAMNQMLSAFSKVANHQMLARKKVEQDWFRPLKLLTGKKWSCSYRTSGMVELLLVWSFKDWKSNFLLILEKCVNYVQNVGMHVNWDTAA